MDDSYIGKDVSNTSSSLIDLQWRCSGLMGDDDTRLHLQDQSVSEASYDHNRSRLFEYFLVCRNVLLERRGVRTHSLD